MTTTHEEIDRFKTILCERITEMQAEATGTPAFTEEAQGRREDARAIWRVLQWLDGIQLAPAGLRKPDLEPTEPKFNLP